MKKETVSTLDMIELIVTELRQRESRIGKIAADIEELKTRKQNDLNLMTIFDCAGHLGIQMPIQTAAMIDSTAMRVCKKQGIQVKQIEDSDFGILSMYPMIILEEVFDDLFCEPKIE